MTSSQPDFIKVLGRFQEDHQAFRIYGSLLSSKIYFFSAFHLAPTTGESEIFNASKSFAIFSKNFFLLTLTPEFDVTVTVFICVL